MVIKCPNCNNWTESTSKFCPVCGTPLTALYGVRSEDIPNPIEDGLPDSPTGPAGMTNETAGMTAGPNGTPNRPEPDPVPKAGSYPQGSGPRAYNRPPKRSSHKILIIVLGAVIAMALLTMILAYGIYTRVSHMTDHSVESITSAPPSETGEGTFDEGISDEGTIQDGEEEALFPETDLAPEDEETESGNSESGFAAENDPTVTTDVTTAELANAGYTNLKALPAVETGQVLLDQAGVVVTLTGFGLDSYDALTVTAHVVNNSGRDVVALMSDVLVNTYLIDTYTFLEVEAGGDGDLLLEFFNRDINITGITNIGEIRFITQVVEPETYNPIASSDNRIETSDYAQMDTTPNDDGFEIANTNGLRIVAKSVEEDDDDSGDQLVYFYMQNNSDKKVTFEIRDVFLNGEEVYSLLYSDLPAGSQAVNYFYVYHDELEQYGIERIDEIGLTAAFYDSANYSMIKEIEDISLSVTYE